MSVFRKADAAEVHFGTSEAAEDVMHEVFLEIHAGWSQLLSAGNLEQGAWAIVRRVVHDRLEAEGRGPAFVINGPIAQALDKALVTARDKLHKMESTSGLYEAIAACYGAGTGAVGLLFMWLQHRL